MKYIIQVTETVINCGAFEVEASSEEEAIKKAKDLAQSGSSIMQFHEASYEGEVE